MQQDAIPGPLYQAIKKYVVDHIESGEWVPGRRIPSESEIVKIVGASRMTVNRALRELSSEGRVTRVQGVGTFVAIPPAQVTLLSIRSIADEIAERGGEHSCRIVLQERRQAPVAVARALEISTYAPVFHVVLLHSSDGHPVQIEDRFVNPIAAPGFIEQDFTATTPSRYLLGLLPVTEVEHNIEARLPEENECELLDISLATPVLEFRRRTWSESRVVTSVALVSAGSESYMGGRFKVGAAPRA